MSKQTDSVSPEGLKKGGCYIKNEDGSDTLQHRTAPGKADTRKLEPQPATKKAKSPKKEA